MKPSAELRWFFKGQLPPQVKDWFCGAKLSKEETPRADHYLVFPGSSEVGVKVREGWKLEIKARTHPPEPFSLATGASVGRHDAWVKWKHEDNEVAGRLAALATGSADWVVVTKKRRLRKFRIGRDSSVEEVDPEVTEGVHCRVELTELDVRGSAWWTLAFDSFGEGKRADRLEQVARHFLKALPHGLALTERDSMAYPEWLNRVANAA
jgi:hypothetical protein